MSQNAKKHGKTLEYTKLLGSRKKTLVQYPKNLACTAEIKNFRQNVVNREFRISRMLFWWIF